MTIREEDRLIAELRRHGMRYLAEGHAVAAEEIAALPPLAVPDLIQRLAACADARVRNATIALLLRHPDYAAHTSAALTGADEATAEQIKTLALAALYLQHLWRTKLKMVLGEQPWLQVNYWRERDLPAPWLYCGEMGLRALQDYEQRRRNLPINFLDDWDVKNSTNCRHMATKMVSLLYQLPNDEGPMATILRGYKTELDLNNCQRTLCLRHAGAARWAYNYGLARKQEVYARRKAAADPKSVTIPTAIDLHNEIITLKQQDKLWLKTVSKWTPQQALRNLDTAFDRFFKKQAKYPQFKKRNKGIGSFYVETPIHVGVDWIQLPILGKVRLFEHGYIPQDCESDKLDRKAEQKRQKKRRDAHVLIKYKSAVISEQAGHWFVAVLVQETILDLLPTTGKPIGVDLGVKTLAVCSDEMEISNPHALKSNLTKLKRKQRQHSKLKKGSKKKQKSKQKLAKVHYRIGNIRTDALHQATAKLTAKAKPEAQRPAAIILEDLNVAGMLKNHTLAQAIADVGLGEFRRQMTYKSRWYGNALYLAHPFFPSTQLCSRCHRLPSVYLDLSVRIYHCEHCGLVLDRDLNAARNLVWLYTASSAEIDACGVIVRPETLVLRAVTLKQEPNTT